MKWFHMVMIAMLILVGLLPGCSSADQSFIILSSSENQAMEPILQAFAKEKGIQIQMVYKGSVDIKNELEQNADSYDAVWAANSLWIQMGDRLHKVKHAKSIMTSPVVFGIRKSLAQELGFVGTNVKVAQIAEAVTANKLKFMTTSATQSNSGASAYIGFLYAMLGNPDAISKEDLHKPELKSKMRQLFQGVNRSSGSSEWLKDLFLKGNYDAMVNYEALIIETNQQLIKQGKEPLYLVYPIDGLTIADYTLGYIHHGDAHKEAFFKELQSHLLSSKVQDEILKLGRRTGFGGTLEQADLKIFNPNWGINPKQTLSPIRYPEADVIEEALQLYQTTFKKPSFTVFALDYSGSMAGEGSKQLKNAMSVLLDQQKAKKYLLQASDEDVVVVIPFDHQLMKTKEAKRLEDYDELLKYVTDLQPDGGTNIYLPSIEGLEILKNVDPNQYTPAVILMTDGKSDGNISQLKSYYQQLQKDIPIFSITFGDASTKQLDEISELTRGRVFDGQADLIEAFKKARGYN